MKLPRQQGRVLEAIIDHVRKHGYSPSIEDLNAVMGISSTSTMHYHLQALERKGFISRVKGKQRAIQLREDLVREGLPIVGRITAGKPLMAIEDRSEYLNLGSAFYRPDNFVLMVKGQSMVEDHITDGDMVIIQPVSVANDGDTVVALIDNDETTLKRFYHEGQHKVRLQPANATMAPLILPSERVQLQGKVIGVVRRM
jgi:repressor LexA